MIIGNTIVGVGTALAMLATRCPAEEIDVRAYGVRPDTKENMVPVVRRVLEACKGKAVSLAFPKGRYDFYPDKADAVTIAFHFKGLKGVTLDGGGAEFVFHGLMMPVRVEGSEKITIKNFILLTTPEKTVIEKNYFRTAGTAILIEGDTSFWYESGANTDVVVRNNVFEDCLTSGGSGPGIRGQWGNAIISITPSHLPQSVDTETKASLSLVQRRGRSPV
ncbi:MAG: hypothetical protein ABIK89_23165 [Planctomycetota bacterium]